MTTNGPRCAGAARQRNRFVIAERAKLSSLGELSRLLQADQPST
jgi:hypothetical protein